MPPLLQALRPHQWTKNLILFVPLVFAQRMSDPASVLRAIAAFVVFCLLSGAIYLINDLRDLEQDRVHPVKRQRPLASGRLTRLSALLALVSVLTLGLVGSVLITVHRLPEPVHIAGHAFVRPTFLACALTYLALLSAYTFYLKHVVILDVMVIAMGFVVRAVAGTAAITVDISRWLLICTIFLSLFLAFSKRRHEITLLAGEAGNHRATLAEYDTYLLDQMIGVVASASVISYSLYTMAPETIDKFATDRLNLTIPFVVYGLFRYLYLVHKRAEGGDPSVSLLTDPPLLAAVALWGVAVVAILYG